MIVVNRNNNIRKNRRRGDHTGRASYELARPEGVSSEPLRHLDVGIDTARYGHHVSFLREDKELAAPPLPITESHAGYHKLQTRLEELHQRHPDAHIHLRIDAAGQYAANLEAFLRALDHLPLIVSIGEPKRNKDYHRAHSPKRKHDASESLAMARYAVVERPEPSHGKPPQFAVLRRVASRLQGRLGARSADQISDRSEDRGGSAQLARKDPVPEAREGSAGPRSGKKSIAAMSGEVAEELIRDRSAN